jgi:condensin complex subunit 1
MFALGSLLDKTLRMEMENPIFRKLQDAIEHPCRSKDWFGMAEQAINTIYALGEHPDQLCNDLIKNLTRRAFTRRPKPEGLPAEEDAEAMAVEDDQENELRNPISQAPSSTHILSSQQSSTSEGNDLGDVFHLSQLLFVVGHVAIKHIVFLELVEREWKRQKDEKQLGMLTRRHSQTRQ